MDRREFLKTTTAVAAASGLSAAGAEAIASPAVTRARREIRVASVWSNPVQGPGDSARRLLREIEIATDGRLSFTLVASGAAGIEALKSGAADAYHGSEHDNLSIDRAFAYFAGLPGSNGMRPSTFNAWLVTAGGQSLWDDLSASFGAKAVFAGHLGRSTGLWSRKPLNTLSDIAGCRAAGLGLATDVLRGIGADARHLPMGGVEHKFSSGDLDAAEAGGAITVLSLGMAAPGLQRTGVTLCPMGTIVSLGFNRQLWDELADSDRLTIEALAAREVSGVLAEEKAHRHMLLHSSMPLRNTPMEVGQAVSRVSDAVVAHLAAASSTTERIHASYAAFRTTVGIDAHRAGRHDPMS